MARIVYNGGSQTVTGTQQSDQISPLNFADDNGGVAFTSGGDDTVFGLGGADTLLAGDDNDRIFGGSGSDTLTGGNGNDTLFGGADSDVLFGESGNDVLAVETNLAAFGTDRFSGGTGFDRVVFQTATVTEQFFSNPTVSIAEATQGVFVNMINSFVPGFVGNIGNVAGGSLDIFGQLSSPRGTIRDANGTTAIFADIEEFDLTAFTDHFLDSSASHIIDGGAGSDFISGGGGADVIDGGAGNDTAMYNLSTSGVSIALLDLGSGGTGSGGEANGDKLFNIENVFGSGHNDFMLGDANANILRGFGGNDTLLGGGGVDTVDGGEGNDSLRGGTGNDKFVGGGGTDTALLIDWNGASSSIFSTVRGAITLADGDGTSTAVLTRSTFSGFTGGFVTTTLETDTLTGIENVTGSDFAETITGNGSANVLDGRGGNDTLDGAKGSDTLIGGDGIDTASFASGSIFESERVEASLVTGEATVFRTSRSLFSTSTTEETDTLSGIENLTGTAGSDTLIGNSAVNTLDGGAGNDLLTGLGGGDVLRGGDGGDTASYTLSQGIQVNLALNTATGGDAQGDTFSSIENLTGSGFDDTLIGTAGINTIFGSSGNDVIEGGAGADTLDGGFNVNTLSYAGSAGVTMSLDSILLATGDAAGDTVSNFLNLSGSSTGDDTLRGDAAINVLTGNGGNDILAGGGSGDTLDGGEGFDFADYRDDGAVRIDLQQSAQEGAAAGDIFISIEGFLGGDGDNVMKGDDAGNTFITANGDNILLGRGGNDILTGGSGQDNIQGGDQDDAINGGIQADRLLGNAGIDTLLGNGGGDEMNGGIGDDTMTGGGGQDIFIFTGQNAGQDTITDFRTGIDTIEFNTALVDNFADVTFAGNGTDQVTVIYGNQLITVIGDQPFTLTANDFNIV